MPKKRIPPTERIDNEIKELRFNLGEEDAPKDFLGKLVKLSMQRIVQEILEAEVQERVGGVIRDTQNCFVQFSNIPLGSKECHKTTL